jgi:predicted MPP superfamily phosphohydrolase
MAVFQLWLIPIAIGHASFCIFLINVLNGFGIKDRILHPGVRIGLLTLAVTTVLASVALGRIPWHDWPMGIRIYVFVCIALAMVILPVITLLRALRKSPYGVSGKSTDLDLAGRDGAERFLGEGSRVWMLRLPGNESLRLRTEDWHVEVPGLPQCLESLSVVQLADLHFAPCYSSRYFEAVADEAARWQADLVFFTGDLIDFDDGLKWIEPVLSRVTARIGKFAILGNHDYSHNARAIRRELGSAGFENLDGRWVSLDSGDATLALGGTSYPWGPPLDPKEMPEADVRLVLSHSPDLLYQAASWNVDLMFSGHNHGGQVRFPVLGPIFMPSRYSRRLDQGFFRHRRTLLYVSRGVGGKDPIRYGSPPEITRFVLHPVSDSRLPSIGKVRESRSPIRTRARIASPILTLSEH